MVLETLGEKSLPLFAVTLFFCILCLVTVTLRCFVRISIRGFGMDDWLMVIGELLATGTFITVMIGCYQGVGQHDTHLTELDYQHVKHVIVSFQAVYCSCLIFVKSSICCALIRLATDKRILAVLYFTMAISCCYGFITTVTVLSLCHPLEATWNPSKGTCASQSVVVDISYFVSACSIVTDLSCSILPYIILWNLQMPRRLKLTVAGLLGLGFLASAATIVRLFYLPVYTATEEYAYKVSDVCLWTMIETGVAITVASIPSLKPLLRNFAFFNTATTDRPSNDYDSYQLDAMDGSSRHETHIKAKGPQETVVEESDSMKEILRDEDDTRIYVNSEILIENNCRA